VAEPLFGRQEMLEAEQLLALQSDGTRINGQTVLREKSLLRSGEKPLPVSLLIPDAVLTGQRYDVDVIFDEPLDGALAAGGISAITPQQQAAMASPTSRASSPAKPNTCIGRVRNRFMNQTVSRSISTRKVRSMP
jgi:hypothetical protein